MTRSCCSRLGTHFHLHLDLKAPLIAHDTLSSFITPLPLITIMSDWIGPNIYRIENHKDRKVAVTLKDGKGDNGSAVVMM
jgi:hypothetical protein